MKTEISAHKILFNDLFYVDQHTATKINQSDFIFSHFVELIEIAPTVLALCKIGMCSFQPVWNGA